MSENKLGEPGTLIDSIGKETSKSRKERIIALHEKVKKRGKIIGEFKDFLREYKILALAIAFIMGVAANSLIKSLVDNIIMPVLTFFIPDGAWQTATLTMGSIVIKWGAFLGEFINFVILAFVIFLIAKFVMKEEKVGKK